MSNHAIIPQIIIPSATFQLIQAAWRIDLSVSILGHHWCRYWRVACLAPIHHLRQLIVNWTIRNKFQWNLTKNTAVSSKKIYLKMWSGKWRPPYLGVNKVYFQNKWDCPWLSTCRPRKHTWSTLCYQVARRLHWQLWYRQLQCHKAKCWCWLSCNNWYHILLIGRLH